jgi:NTE family protein
MVNNQPDMRKNGYMSDTPASTMGGVFGGGGLFGIGYAMGVLEGLKPRGIDLSSAPLLGTSAGSWAAAATAFEIPFATLAEMPVPSFPNPKPGLLASIARDIFGDRTDPLIQVVACALPRLKRTILDGGIYPLSDLVAASSAVPALLSPHTVGGTRYVDGGVRSGTSVDYGPAVSQLVLIAPLAGAMWGPFARIIDNGMHNEVERWKERTNGKVLIFTPHNSAATIARNPRHLFDKARAIEAYHWGREEATSYNLTFE